MTLFPQMITDALSTSITGRAIKSGLIRVNAVQIRDYTNDKHGKTEDAPYGGGAGLVMQAQPIYDCWQAVHRQIREDRLQALSGENKAAANAEFAYFVKYGVGSGSGHYEKRPRVLYMSPQGRRFDQSFAEELAKGEELVFLCGHYEGVDERALELIGAEEVSIGDFVLTGGELPAIMMIDCISRLIPGVLGNDDSAEIESFHDSLLEYPQYSRPEVYRGLKVPEVLLSGHHANVDKWRRQQSIRRTLEKRPDLLENANLDKKEKKYLDGLLRERKIT
ncbi:MAG: tRNA (guanosine(37)-N1)-methyltransferase TrmD [Lachnospiraceae bacterium]|nr:tRNA (guanosine(37)-N1)-methyltransferase TrmD [Lachnospiraceae bacterium]